MQHKIYMGCGIVILNSTKDKVLLGTRRKEPDINGYQIPGGTVDYDDGENLLEAAVREVEEETGLKVKDTKFLCMMNSFYYGKERPISIGFVAQSMSDEIPANPEPHKADDWKWVPLDAIPEGKWFRLSKTAVDFYIELLKDPTLDRFVIDSEYVNLK
ncbi:MAG: NUDIX domain-containing protein [bacterium]